MSEAIEGWGYAVHAASQVGNLNALYILIDAKIDYDERTIGQAKQAQAPAIFTVLAMIFTVQVGNSSSTTEDSTYFCERNNGVWEGIYFSFSSLRSYIKFRVNIILKFEI